MKLVCDAPRHSGSREISWDFVPSFPTPDHAQFNDEDRPLAYHNTHTAVVFTQRVYFLIYPSGRRFRSFHEGIRRLPESTAMLTTVVSCGGFCFAWWV